MEGRIIILFILNDLQVETLVQAVEVSQSIHSKGMKFVKYSR